MITKMICCCHRGPSHVMDPIIEKYRETFLLICGGAKYHIKGTDAFYDSMFSDDEGDNISWANPLCSEATSLFWMYKHMHQIGYFDMIGLCHYRRIFDVDYNNLDVDAVYVKQCDYPIPGHPDYLGCKYSSPLIGTMIRDEYLDKFPYMYDIMRMVENDFTFFDKEMFIMNRGLFLVYMDYITQCLRLLLNDVLPQVALWHEAKPSLETELFVHSRGCSYFMEYFNLLYFTRLKHQGYRVIVTPITKDSYHGN